MSARISLHGDGAPDQRIEQVVAGPEMVFDRRMIRRAGMFGDPAVRNAVDPVDGEEFFRRIHQRFARLLAMPAHAPAPLASVAKSIPMTFTGNFTPCGVN